jgi:hypothetical protein
MQAQREQNYWNMAGTVLGAGAMLGTSGMMGGGGAKTATPYSGAGLFSPIY